MSVVLKTFKLFFMHYRGDPFVGYGSLVLNPFRPNHQNANIQRRIGYGKIIDLRFSTYLFRNTRILWTWLAVKTQTQPPRTDR